MSRAGGPFSGLFWRRQRRFLAIDFDSCQVRIVQAEQAPGGPRILKLAAAEVPSDLDIADNLVLRAARLAGADEKVRIFTARGR